MLDSYPLHGLLAQRRAAIGLMLNFASAPLVEISALMGFDFIVIDAEHGPVDAADAEPMIRAAELARIAPIIRVPTARPDISLRYLDLGATGIMFPHIHDAQEARSAVEAVRFPPRGKRGVAPSTNASGYGVRMPYRQYMEHANSLLLPMIIIEEAEAVEEIERIVAVEGIAAIVVGTMDLSASMGFPGEPGRPEVEAAIGRVISAAKGAGLPVCLAGGALEAARQNLRLGADMLFTPIGSWLAAHGKAYTEALRGAWR